ncbi:MAG: hypothetical protein ACHP7F_09495, partial [Actinomycetales bacterium]
MATSTKSTSRARNSSGRGGSNARKPAAKTTTQKTVAYPAADASSNLLVRAWLGLAHLTGA